MTRPLMKWTPAPVSYRLSAQPVRVVGPIRPDGADGASAHPGGDGVGHRPMIAPPRSSTVARPNGEGESSRKNAVAAEPPSFGVKPHEWTARRDGPIAPLPSAVL